ncbi:MAG TPA: hypothetical protein PKD99_12500 [Sphingopyxis sp.]|nr:hypothetical protein [Sphingopyxis sp.]HMP45919.1 hypothetical protein [Sphingopyxis sp.]HMQ20090.1 hypothetical protein [Sphingopyxis sp.]
MTVTEAKTMANDAKRPGAFGLIGWPVAIVMGSAMLLGGFAGYNQAAIDNGEGPLPVWAGPLAALAFAAFGLAFYLRRYAPMWRQWSPRKRRYWLTLAFCGAIGGVVGGWLVIDQPGERGLTEMLASGALSPGFAIGAALLWTAGLAVGMIFYHRTIDDHEERAWLWAGVAGWYAFIFPAPVWWVLHRAALAPPADVMLLFCLSLIVNAVVWMWLKFR